MKLGEWTERPHVADAVALELPPEVPEPTTAYELLTRDGQRLRAVLFGEGRLPRDPWIIRLDCYRLARDELETGQELGEARWPRIEEIRGAVDQVPDGAVFQLPPAVSGGPSPEPTRMTRLQLVQVNALEGSAADQGPRIARPGRSSHPETPEPPSIGG